MTDEELEEAAQCALYESGIYSGAINQISLDLILIGICKAKTY